MLKSTQRAYMLLICTENHTIKLSKFEICCNKADCFDLHLQRTFLLNTFTANILAWLVMNISLQYGNIYNISVTHIKKN